MVTNEMKIMKDLRERKVNIEQRYDTAMFEVIINWLKENRKS
ncbi:MULTISPECIES: hypothetical protein [unclassified Bacillus (in: firmicutes)]